MRQTRIRRYGLVLAMLAATPAGAQPADLPIPPATTGEYPPGVKVAKTPAGMVYAAADGRTLYGMDMRTLIRWGPDPSQYCREACAETWEPLLAPAGAKPNLGYPTRGSGSRATPGEGLVQPQRAPDWAIIAGPQGPQWVYKGWHMVFVRKGDKPSSTAKFQRCEWRRMSPMALATWASDPTNSAVQFGPETPRGLARMKMPGAAGRAAPSL